MGTIVATTAGNATWATANTGQISSANTSSPSRLLLVLAVSLTLAVSVIGTNDTTTAAATTTSQFAANATSATVTTTTTSNMDQLSLSSGIVASLPIILSTLLAALAWP